MVFSQLLLAVVFVFGIEIDPKPVAPRPLIEALIQKESAGDAMAVSPVGAEGLAQAMPNTARDPGFGVRPLMNPFNPVEARRFAREYLTALLWQFDDPGHAIMAYNWGPANVRVWIKKGSPPDEVPEETKDYVRTLGPTAVRVLQAPISTTVFTLRTKTERAIMRRAPWEKVLRDALDGLVQPPDGTATAQVEIGSTPSTHHTDMTIEQKIKQVEDKGIIEVDFQNPRIDLIFRALKENYLLIMDGVPCRVLGAKYNKSKDTVVFGIDREGPQEEIRKRKKIEGS